MSEHLTGLIAAPHTPMHPDGSINLKVIGKQAKCLIENDIKGVYVCGSTGEGISLSTDERREVAERWKTELGDSMAIVIQVGHHSVKDAKALAEHAEKQIGARAIGSLAPSYFKPRTIDDLVSFCAEVASGAPATPFYYYHQPRNSGVYFDMIDFLPKAAERIETFAGLKFSHGDMMDYGRCLDFEDGRFNILFGIDEALLAAVAIGGRGAIGSTYNFAAPLYHSIVEAYEKSDMAEAQRQQRRARELVAVINKYGGQPAIKAAMKVIGIDCGPCRAPLRTLSDEQYEEFRVELEQIGFFSYCSNIEQ